MENRKSFETHWENIVDNFDFSKVYEVMKVLDWTWDRGGLQYIPALDAIMDSAHKMCKMAYDNGSCNSGGFQCYYSKEDDVLELSFSIENWATEYAGQ